MTPPRNPLEGLVAGAVRLGARVLAAGLDTVLNEVRTGIANGAAEADRRIKTARRRLENVVDMNPCEECGFRHSGDCAIEVVEETRIVQPRRRVARRTR